VKRELGIRSVVLTKRLHILAGVRGSVWWCGAVDLAGVLWSAAAVAALIREAAKDWKDGSILHVSELPKLLRCVLRSSESVAGNSID